MRIFTVEADKSINHVSFTIAGGQFEGLSFEFSGSFLLSFLLHFISFFLFSILEFDDAVQTLCDASVHVFNLALETQCHSLRQF